MLAVRFRFREAEPPAGTEMALSPVAAVLSASDPNWYVSQLGAPSRARLTVELPPME